jgi:energy-coupling factor transporter ATP-binding protein EcfA2
MKLSALRLHNVRRFADKGIAIEGIADGVNLLCAANEYGKSTCFDALHALFFQAHTGTASAVRALQPYGGGSPLVEADIVTSEGAFRLTKKFVGGRRAIVRDIASGRVIAQADEAERFIGNLVRGGSGGPAGLLWVRQGNTGLEKRSRADDAEEKTARETLLTSVQGELEALTGGRRMTDVLEACEDDLARLVTSTLRAKAGGPYARAIEERDRLAAEETKLAKDVEDLRSALLERRAIRRQLATIDAPEEETARRAAATAAEKAYEQTKAQREALNTAEAQAALARNRHDQAKAKLDAFRANMVGMRELRAQYDAALKRRDDAAARQRAALSADTDAAAKLDAAEREEQAARDLLDRLAKAERARDAALRLEALRERLSQAEVAQKEIAEGEAASRSLDVPDKALRELEQLDTEIAGLRAAATMNAPSLRVDYESGAQGRVTLDGISLKAGDERAITAPIALTLDGIGTLSLTPGQAVTRTDRLSAAEDQRRQRIAALGVQSLQAVRERQALARDRKSDTERARDRLKIYAPDGVAALRDEIAALAALGAGDLELKGDPDRMREAHQVAQMRVADTRQAVKAANSAQQEAGRALVEAETALAGIVAKRDALAAQLGPEEERGARESVLAEDLTQASEKLRNALALIDTLALAADALAKAEAAYQRTQSALKAADAERARLKQSLAGLDGRIRTRADDAVEEVWQETVDARKAAEARVARFRKEVDVLVRLRDAFASARTEARDHYFEPVMRELRPLIGLLFDDASVSFDDSTLLPLSLNRSGQEEKVEHLSGGMREQLAILTRLAFARLLARSGHPAPVILDDALVYSDDDRIERMFDALHRQSRDQQIIVFSCRQRAFSRLGGHVLQIADWSPQA